MHPTATRVETPLATATVARLNGISLPGRRHCRVRWQLAAWRIQEKVMVSPVVFAALFFSQLSDAKFIDPVFDVQALIATPLNPRTLKSSERDGIVTEEVRFHSERDGEKDVEIFAFF